MYKKILFFCLLSFLGKHLSAQEIVAETSDIPPLIVSISEEKPELPVVSYSLTNQNTKYTIAGITVSGVESYGYEDYVLIGISGLSVGDKITVPGEEITSAVRLFWRHGLFSDVKILATKQTADSVWLEIALKPNPLISTINFTGVKKSEREDLEARIGMARGSQLTPNLISRARIRILAYFAEKGFSNISVNIQQRDDLSDPGKVILDIDIDKNQKTKIQNIFILGNEEFSDNEIKMAMKKTNEGFSLPKRPLLSIRKLFSTKKFVDEDFRNDLENIILKYNERGYRDAFIVADSVVQVNDKQVDVFITIHEGNQYHIRNINWVGNTLYSADFLDYILSMEPGDLYNTKKLNERLEGGDNGVLSGYQNQGYLFARVDPVEINIENDSIDLEIRVIEGIQATINRVIITGNDRLYEDIVRRELMTKPGQLFSRDAVMESVRGIAQMGHFDPETSSPDIQPDVETGTVDISYNLTSKPNDQIELSAGWGQTGLIGRLSLKFTNFSFNNLLKPSTYRGIIPQGDGQTLTLSGQTNGRYYQSYSISFMDPWFGGKRPNQFSVGAYYMIQTGMESRYASNMYSYYPGMGSYYGDYAYDDNQSMRILGLSVGYGKRLRWPDHNFSLMSELSYQRYTMNNWRYFEVQNGTANSLTLGLTLGRNSIDNPLYTRRGSSFAVSVNATPPYSLWDGVDYANLKQVDPQMYKWMEYHKWKFKGRIFMPFANPERVKRTPVLMSRIEYGFLGSYNSHKHNPFQTFYMGGDGMTGYTTMYATETIGLRGYESGALTPGRNAGYAYSRLALELRYPLIFEQSSTIYALAFVEAGNAWTNLRSFSPFDLKRSAGVGARIFLPMIGLMGLDWAYGFDKPNPGAGVSGSQVHFIIGQEF
jgi:outer membrane protein insertion porin family